MRLVTIHDLNDTPHSVDVTAETLYDAVAQAIVALRGREWVGEIGRGLAVALAPPEDFRRDSGLFLDCVRKPEALNRIKTAMKRGFQTREAEMALPRMLDDLASLV
jgi:hypothetical protein